MTDQRRLIWVVLAVAFTLRVWGLGFGLPYVMARPDEAEIAGPAVGYLSGDLRPPFLEWPSMFAYATALVYVLYFAAQRPFGGYPTLAAFAESRRADISPFLYVTRAMSAVMGTLAVWWLYRLGERAFSRSVGLVAASYLAVSYLAVRDSHFGVTDTTMAALAVAAVGAAVRWHQEGGWRRAGVAGLLAGLTASAKYNGALVASAFATAVAQRTWTRRVTLGAPLLESGRALAVFTAGFVAAFFGTSPYVLLDWPRALASMRRTGAMFLQGHGLAVGQGWWYYGSAVLPAAVGWAVFAAGLAGVAALVLRRFRVSAVVLAFPIVYYLVAGRGLGVFARYILPVIPFLCLSAAWVTVEGVRLMTRRSSPAVRRVALTLATLLMCVPGAYKSVLLDRLLSAPDNREVTGRALSELIPPGSLLYQTGEPYGHASLFMDRRQPPIVRVRFDSGTGRFDPAEPGWILVQRSPLVLYSSVPAAIEELLHSRYVLVRRFPTGLDASAHRIFDQQDAFYVPLAGLEGLRRPGPAFELYMRRE